MYSQHIRRITPREDVIAHFMKHARAYLPRTCWADPCASWFKQGSLDGPVVMWPGSRLAFFEAVKTPQWEDYDIQYHSGNRFGFLGSGFAPYEFGEQGESSPYLNGDFVPTRHEHELREMIAKEKARGFYESDTVATLRQSISYVEMDAGR
ncbi:hypothetical protein BDV36DRAFT_291885 [Aspergillus pseudocaelatus]|uniref:Cytochrome P450 n=1 Tax=Aspergillus pseudocaelatus TaxID=1825620 RepID=A0ABQ6X147_9EURO|nr:hypothetical protein BDV36DRAFT_291885 [Aspergillus pseudocaelatus]